MDAVRAQVLDYRRTPSAARKSDYERAVMAHALHFVEVLERQGPRLHGAGQPDGGAAQLAALNELEIDQENLQVAFTTALDQRALSWLLPLTANLRRYFEHISEYLRLEETCAAVLVEAMLLEDEPLQLAARIGLASA